MFAKTLALVINKRIKEILITIQCRPAALLFLLIEPTANRLIEKLNFDNEVLKVFVWKH